MTPVTLPSTTGKQPRWLPYWGTLWPYVIVHLLFHMLYAVAARVRVEGLEHLPMQGKGVVVCNHTKGADYFPLGFSSPRQFFFMAKAEAFDFNPLLSWFMRTGGVFPVDRNKGDVHALNVAVEIVNSGKLLAMFPEGHRSPDGTLQRGKTGATRIALQAGAPVIPVAVIGAEAAWRNFPRFWKRPYLVVRYGKPFALEGSAGDRAAVAAGTRRIMHEIAALLPAELRGEWSGNPDEAAPATTRRARRTAEVAADPASARESDIAMETAAS